MWLEAVTQLVATLVVGRLCLSVLPPGWPGYHDGREGGATLGASVLLGWLGWSLLPYWFLWGLALGLRWLLLPGAMRPRHELATPRGRLLDRGVLLVAVGAGTWATWSSPGAPRDSQALLAPAAIGASVLGLHALFVRLRWRPAVRSAGLALYAGGVVLVLCRVPGPWLAPGLLGASWVLAGLWTRRRFADRRGAWLAGGGVLAVGLLTPWSLIGT